MPTSSYGCDFMMGLGKSKLCTKFEVSSFSHCVNIEEELILGAPLAQGHAHPFFCVILWWTSANPSCVPNLKSLAPAVAEIL